MVLGCPQAPFAHGMTARLAPLGASPSAVANTTCELSGDQSGCVALVAPRGRSPSFAPVARSTIHILPFHAAMTWASSGEIVAKPWPPVSGTCLTSGLGGAARVTSMIQRLLPDIALTGAAMYLPSRDTTWQATQLTLSAGVS